MVLVRVGTNHVCRSPSSPPNVPIARSRGTANSIATSTRAARTDTTLLRALSGSRGQNGVLAWLRWRWTQITTAAGLQLRKMAAAVTAPPRRRPRRPRPRRTRRRPQRRPRRSAAARPPRFPTPRSHHSAPHARIVLRPLMTGHVLWRSCCCCCCCALVVGGGGCTPHSPVRSAGPAGPALWAPRPIRRWVARERTTRVCEVA